MSSIVHHGHYEALLKSDEAQTCNDTKGLMNSQQFSKTTSGLAAASMTLQRLGLAMASRRKPSLTLR